MKPTRKIVVLGLAMVGKTATIRRLTTGKFDQFYEPTYENTFETSIKWNQSEVQLVITDTRGQDEQDMLMSQFGLKDGFVLMYSVTSRQSFEVAKAINDKLMTLTGTSHVPRVLIANKVDQEKVRKISYSEGRQAADEMGCAFLECSAAQGNNVEQIFQLLLAEIDRESGTESEIASSSRCVPSNICCCVNWQADEWGTQHSYRFALSSVIITLFLGLLSVVGGFLIIRTQESLLSYMLVGMGFFVFIFSLLGSLGLHKDNKEYLTSYGFAIGVALLVDLSVGIVLFNQTDLIEKHAASSVSLFILSLIAQLFAVASIFWHQRNMQRERDADDQYSPPYQSLFE